MAQGDVAAVGIDPRVIVGDAQLAQQDDRALNDYLSRVRLTAHTARSIVDRKDLRRVVEQGYAVVDQELDSGLRSVAVPVTTANDELLGAINISTNAARVDMDTLLGRYLALLQDKAQQIRKHAR